MMIRYTILLLVAAVILPASLAEESAPQELRSCWLPSLRTPQPLAEFDAGDYGASTQTVSWSLAPPVAWVETLDLNGDLKEDAVVTIATSEGAGARGWLLTHTSYVCLGTGAPRAGFRASRSTNSFSVQTLYRMHQTKFPDTEIRRQFRLVGVTNGPCVEIVETMYENLAGDSSTRGMLYIGTCESTEPLTAMTNWSPTVTLHQRPNQKDKEGQHPPGHVR